MKEHYKLDIICHSLQCHVSQHLYHLKDRYNNNCTKLSSFYARPYFFKEKNIIV